MDAVHLILYIAHMLAMVAIVVAPVIAGRGQPLQVWGARIQLIIGLLLTGLAEMGDDPVNHAKIAVKLIVAIAVVGCAEVAHAKHKRGEAVSTLAWSAAGLAVVNAAIAFLW